MARSTDSLTVRAGALADRRRIGDGDPGRVASPCSRSRSGTRRWFNARAPASRPVSSQASS
ncbi:hypothetical protein [Amycolatopsis kentuckyensis]|uniref:hypothetical protein n=1 Tax=Amycolatopsis kentuckyensis TaxID=218823 RepID=UPI001177CCD5|nr:hypothetical protein [Amycolatopsis kentuckyensis]